MDDPFSDKREVLARLKLDVSAWRDLRSELGGKLARSPAQALEFASEYQRRRQQLREERAAASGRPAGVRPGPQPSGAGSAPQPPGRSQSTEVGIPVLQPALPFVEGRFSPEPVRDEAAPKQYELEETLLADPDDDNATTLPFNGPRAPAAEGDTTEPPRKGPKNS